MIIKFKADEMEKSRSSHLRRMERRANGEV